MAKDSTARFPVAEDSFHEMVINTIPEGVVAVELERFHIVDWNTGAKDMFGYAREEIVGKEVERLFPDHGSFQRFVKEEVPAIRQDRGWRTECEFRHADGSRFPTELVAAMLQPAQKEGGRLIIVLREIGRRKRLQRELEHRVRQQEIVAELGKQAIRDLDIAGLMERAASLVAEGLDVEYCEVLELTPSANRLFLRAGSGWRDGCVGHATVGAGTDSQAGYTLLANEPVVVDDLENETRFSGSPLLHEHAVVSGISTIIRGREKPYGVIGAHTIRRRSFNRHDINFLSSVANIVADAIERSRVDEELNEAVIERTRLIQLLQAVTVVANEAETVDNALAYTIDHVCEHLSWPVGHAYKAVEGPGMKFASMRYWHLRDPERFAPFRKESETAIFEPGAGVVGRVLASRKVLWIDDLRGEKSFVRADSARRAGLTTGLVLPVLVKKRVVAVLEFFATELVRFDRQLVDVMEQVGVQLGRVVERKEAEHQMRRSSYLSTLGTAAAKVAHEISNPLNGMYTAVQLLERSETGQMGENASSIVRDLKSEIARLRSLLQDFRSLSKPIKFDFEPSSLRDLVQELLKIHAPQYAEKGVQVDCEFPDDLPVVQVDREKLKQGLLNLCQNAVDAMPGGGRLTIRGYRFWDGVCLEVEDTGAGMPEGINIFEEFSTTKSGGTGLGLPIVQQIVSGHKGTLNYTSQRDRGTTVRVILHINF